VVEHIKHAAARGTLARLIAAGDFLGLAPQVLAEFIHIVTDSRRFTRPLDMAAARQLVEQWWTAREVVRVFPNGGLPARSYVSSRITPPPGNFFAG
jgi:predicted nucleic acid-binding protein